MKGIVYTEFLEMVESNFGLEVVDRIIEQSDLASGGAYTAVGTYDHTELLRLVGELAKVTGMTVPDLLRAFGRHLFGRFAVLYPQTLEGAYSSFSFLARIEGIVHVDVRKLYPDAELPTFECSDPNGDELTMIYRSTRPFADFAEGLIMGCAEHFGEKIAIEREDLCDVIGPGVRFTLKKQG